MLSQKSILTLVLVFIFLGFTSQFSLSFADESTFSESTSSSVSAQQMSSNYSMAGLPEEAKLRRWSGEWWMGSSLQGFSEGVDDGVRNKFKLGTKFVYELSPWAKLSFDGELAFTSGRTQTRVEDEYVETGLRIREGVLEVGNSDNYALQIGVIQQKFLQSQLLISDKKSFPGVKEIFVWNIMNSQLSLYAQQTVPTSTSLNPNRAEQEPLPTFLTETVSLKTGLASSVKPEFWITHFKFNNLPAIVAYKSQYVGNMIDGDDMPNSRFRYGFDGLVFGTKVCLCLLKFPITFGSQWLENYAAPSGLNRGQDLGLSVDFELPNQVVIRPALRTFFVEPYLTPGYYTRWEVGNVNRQGYMARMDLEFRRYGFKTQFEYVSSQVLNINRYQFDREIFYIGVETNHVSF